MSKKVKILWVDDEINLLRSQILFLTEKGYDLTTANSGNDALILLKKNNYDLIFLDEMMPGLTGLETLPLIKANHPSTPVIMITKSEEENIMDEAIGNKIADYLIKPVSPNQILLTIKKHIEKERLVAEKTAQNYQSDYSKIGITLNDDLSYVDWMDVYKKLVYWELELQSANAGMDEFLKMQKKEANSAFSKYVKKYYLDWMGGKNAPLMSHNLMKDRILPMLKNNEKVIFILIDNFRLDQWETVKESVADKFNLKEEMYMSILPTATEFARNAIFSGLTPSQIAELYPQYWTTDEEETSHNQFEEDLIGTFFQRFREKIKYCYFKVMENDFGKRLAENYKNLLNHQFSVVVFNFVDMLSHARTESKMIKELASDEAAYRSLTKSWFDHSPLNDLLEKLEGENVKIIITTDHGSIKVDNAIKVVGDRNITTNLRYKQGKSLNYNPKEVFEIKQPEKAMLPKTNLSSTYIFATNGDFFAYPNNYNHYVSYYKDSFQHGGISLEEMIIPFIILEPKNLK